MNELFFLIKHEKDETILLGYKGNEENVIIPNGVTVIGDHAFAWRMNLKSVVIPNSVKRIDSNAFSSTGLQSVTIPKSVSTIGRGAFSFCYSLSSIELPENISIDGSTFMGCYGLADEDGFVIINGILYDYVGKAKNVIIPDGVHTIGEFAFYSKYAEIKGETVTICETVESVYVPSGVTVIGENSFRNCKNLKRVYFAGNVNAIGADDSCGKNEMFLNCSPALRVIIPNFDIINGICADMKPFLAMQYMCNQEEYKGCHENYKRYCIAQKHNLIKRAIKEDKVGVIKYYAEENIITAETLCREFCDLAKKANAALCTEYLENLKKANGVTLLESEPVVYAAEIKKQISKKFKCKVEDLKSVPLDAAHFAGEKKSIEIVEIPPKADWPYRTLITIGIGQFDMAAPSDSKKRMELMVTIPQEENEALWANELMDFYKKINFSKTYFDYGHTVHYNDEAPGRFQSFLLLKGITADKKTVNLKAGNMPINLLRLFPLYESEWEYIVAFKETAKSITDMFSEQDLLAPVNRSRKAAILEI